MKRIILTLASIAFLAVSCQNYGTDGMKVGQIMDKYNVPGLQMVYHAENVAGKGQITENYIFGEDIQKNTIFQAASLSKVVFAYTVMRLVDQGVIELDTPLMSYYDNGRFRTPEDQAFAARLTARLVLSHRTGLPNWAASPSSDEWPYSDIKFKTAPAEEGDTTEMYTYSGEGYAYLQAVVEHLTGLSLNELAMREVFKPFKMGNSWYGWREEFETMVTRGHQEDGTPADIVRYPRANSAYTLMTCASDYYKFIKALSEGKGLRPETFAEMKRPQYEDGDSLRIYGTLPISWGLGIGLTDDGAIWHWGDNGSFKAFFAAYPNQILVYFANSRNGLKMLPDMLDVYFKEKSQQVHEIPAWLDMHYGD